MVTLALSSLATETTDLTRISHRIGKMLIDPDTPTHSTIGTPVPFEFSFSNDGYQAIDIKIFASGGNLPSGPRFEFAFIRMDAGNSHWIDQVLCDDGNGHFFPHSDLGTDFPPGTQQIRILMSMQGKMSIYFRIFVKDRATGAFYDCDPQASNDPDPGKGGGI